jgi:hypothetical protein
MYNPKKYLVNYIGESKNFKGFSVIIEERNENAALCAMCADYLPDHYYYNGAGDIIDDNDTLVLEHGSNKFNYDDGYFTAKEVK